MPGALLLTVVMLASPAPTPARGTPPVAAVIAGGGGGAGGTGAGGSSAHARANRLALHTSPAEATRTPVPVEYSGTGEAFRVRGGEAGSPWRLERSGGADPVDKRVSITFDDGPSPEWTPAVLDTLSRHGVRAAFFVVGARAAEQPQIVKRALAEGHTIGNHTWSHADLRGLPASLLHREVDDTTRAIERATGHSTRLFRAPFDADPAPVTLEQLVPMKWVTRGETIAVGTNADSHDYERPGVDRIVENALGPVRKGWAKIILFHDAGGDRSQTVAALEVTIQRLRAEGYRVVPLPELLGVKPEWANPAARP